MTLSVGLRRYSCTALLAAIGLLCIWSTPSHAVTPAQYARTLQGYADALNSALQKERMNPGSARGLLQRTSRAIQSPISVVEGDGRRIHADLSWISEGFRGIEGSSGKVRADKIASLLARVRATSESAENVVELPPTRATKARSVLDAELSKSEYKPSVTNDFVTRAVLALAKAWERLTSFIPEGAQASMFWIIYIPLALGLIALIVFLVRKMLERPSPNMPSAGRQPRTRASIEARSSVESLLQSSEKAASGGRYGEAFHDLYVAALLMHDRAKIIEYAGSATNWEYVRAVRSKALPEQADILQGMTMLFDRLVYGHMEASRDDYQLGLRHFHRLEELI